MKDSIMTQPISGFMELLPDDQIVFNQFLDIIKSEFERVGAVPIETPAVERVETLLSKGGNEKEIFSIGRLKEIDKSMNDDSNLGLHFDLTVPFARYAAQHYANLTFPFKRFQMQKVYRGERPQAGRYREFYQCDIDVINDGELSLLNDAEMPYVIYRIFRRLDIGPFKIRVSNRKILTGFLESMGIDDDDIRSQILKAIDELEKTGVTAFGNRMREIGFKQQTIEEILTFFKRSKNTKETLASLQRQSYGNMYDIGVDELSTVLQAMTALGIPDTFITVDLSIVRGLDYYTGTIYETTLENFERVGSICSGGRYDNLSEQFTDKKLPGVGISIGLTRLFNVLMRNGKIPLQKFRTAPILLTTLDSSRFSDYLHMADELRRAGLNTEIYLENKKLSVQMKYANRKGHDLVILAGECEFETDSIVLRNMASGEQYKVKREFLVQSVLTMIEHIKA